MIIKNATIYQENGTFEVGNIITCEDRITAVGVFDLPTSDRNSGNEDSIEIDATGLYAIPGLTDIHFHGCAGYDFCDGTREAFDAIATYEAAHGTMTICPATMSLPEEALADICRNSLGYENSAGADLVGIHMEGPYLSVKKKGAQNEAYLRKPDLAMYHRLNTLAGNLFKIVSIAPEEAGAMEFIEELKDKVVLSLAHTTADYNTATEAFQKGASHVTHLYNAMPPFHHRDPAVIGAAFDSPETTVELICDGIHLHPSVVRATIAMFGEDRIIFVSDSMMATGLEEGTYALGGQEVQVKGKKATLMDGTIAGSATNLMDCMINSVRNMGIPFVTAIKASAVNPAKKIGIYKDYGSLSQGKYANIILLDEDFDIKYIILKGYLLTK